MSAKERADLQLLKQGLAESREKAKALIMAGRIYEGEQRIEKAGTLLNPDARLQVKGQDLPYVSRGGLKLEKALSCFPIDLAQKTVLDLGASTGGFTDCALAHGARKVYAVDVGYGQLDYRLREDPRVVVREKTNARYLSPEHLEEKADIVVADLSFISLEKIFPVMPGLLQEEGEGVALIKPQFEAGKGLVDRNGVLRNPALHVGVLCKVLSALEPSGLRPYGLTYSPIKGPKGNIEYLLWFGIIEQKEPPLDPEYYLPGMNENLVKAAFAALGRERTQQ